MSPTAPSDGASRYDLLLKGGRVLSPGGRAWIGADVGVREGRIAWLGQGEEAHAAITADIGGAMVVPGLTDLHVHCYPGATYWGIDVDEVSLRSGVTTVVDAGSAGPHTFAGLAPLLRASRVTALAFLNIAGGGLAAPYGELLRPELADVVAAVNVARRHPDLIAGFKVRVSPSTTGEHWLDALAAVRRAADDVGLPVMVHIAEPPPELATVIDHLRAGDIITHCFTPHENCVVGPNGELRPEVAAAQSRGVLLDVGHGGGSFSFPAAEAYVRSGAALPSVSTDLHRACVNGPAFDMNVVMSKLLAAGALLEDVVQASTATPAAALGRRASLSVGEVADVAVLRSLPEPLTVWDCRGIEREAVAPLSCLLTLRAGEPAFVHPRTRLTATRA